MDFFQIHGIWFLIFIALFPRLTMLFARISGGFGILGWLGWIFTPHITAAIIATMYYWHTNPVLCVIAWIVAIVGTKIEMDIADVVLTLVLTILREFRKADWIRILVLLVVGGTWYVALVQWPIITRTVIKGSLSILLFYIGSRFLFQSRKDFSYRDNDISTAVGISFSFIGIVCGLWTIGFLDRW